ncbi:hypothetical protein PENTCL1PPCAC_12695, partial [Pristionchus entomophagus]
WTPIASMGHARCRFGAVVHDDQIYIAGGFDGDNALATVEIINPLDAAPVWKFAAPMSKPRGAPASCVLDGQLYVFGGHDSTQVWADCERFNPETDS